ESGAVMPGVTVTLSSPGVIGGDQSTVSDGTGAYQFTRLVPGTYSVKAELQGFRAVIQENIRVSADNTSRADLKLAVGDLAETITVTGSSPLLDTTSALNQTVMSREVLDTLPTARDIFSIARLAPALTVGKLDVGGKDSLMNSNSVFIHGSTGRSRPSWWTAWTSPRIAGAFPSPWIRSRIRKSTTRAATCRRNGRPPGS